MVILEVGGTVVVATAVAEKNQAHQANAHHHWHMLIATALGTGLTVMMGIGLMSLIFLSNSSGHDDSAANFKDDYDQRS